MHWCDVCRCWLNDSKAAIQHHERGMGHTEALKRSECTMHGWVAYGCMPAWNTHRMALKGIIVRCMGSTWVHGRRTESLYRSKEYMGRAREGLGGCHVVDAWVHGRSLCTSAVGARMSAWSMHRGYSQVLRLASLLTSHSWPPNAELRDMTRKADQEKRTAEHVESSMQRCGVGSVEYRTQRCGVWSHSCTSVNLRWGGRGGVAASTMPER